MAKLPALLTSSRTVTTNFQILTKLPCLYSNAVSVRNESILLTEIIIYFSELSGLSISDENGRMREQTASLPITAETSASVDFNFGMIICFVTLLMACE